MTGLTFTFTGPDGQTVAAVDGRVVVVDVHSWGLRFDLKDAAAVPWPITPTGPWWLGGEGMDDPASVFWAVKYGLPWGQWVHTGDVPEVPDIGPTVPGILY